MAGNWMVAVVVHPQLYFIIYSILPNEHLSQIFKLENAYNNVCNWASKSTYVHMTSKGIARNKVYFIAHCSGTEEFECFENYPN